MWTLYVGHHQLSKSTADQEVFVVSAIAMVIFVSNNSAVSRF